LPPLRSLLDQYHRAARLLVLVSAAFDFPARRLPPNVRYVGTPIDDTSATWDDPWLLWDDPPLVLVSLSTLPQGQTEVLRRILVALEGMPVRALVTLGPALAGMAFEAPPNARLEAFVPHGAVLSHAAALVTQCGLGTIAKALTHGIPMVCIPLVADQADNAVRIAQRGAGIRLHAAASPQEIREALRRVLNDSGFRAEAGRLGATLARDGGADSAAREIERLVRQ
jgi:MGT family glycosyltransferase